MWDQHQIFGYLLLAGPLCGIAMVVGGILLLYTGAISLREAKEDGLSVEFRKELKISTRYPALGLFVIGLMFVALPMFIGTPQTARPIIIKADTGQMADPVSVSMRTANWSSNYQHKNHVTDMIRPEIETVQVTVTSPGYEEYTSGVYLLSSLKNGEIDLGTVELTQAISKADVGDTIIPLPLGDSLQAPDAKPSFGAAR